MATAPQQVLFIDEIADFLASRPAPRQVLAYHPSEPVEQRFHELVQKRCDSSLTPDEESELHQFQQTEILLRLIKARLRAAPAHKP